MARLSERDFRSAFSLLHEAGEVEDDNPFPERVLESLRRLVPSDVVAYHEYPVGHAAVCYAGEPAAEVTPALREASVRHARKDPLRPVEGARKYSDYLSRREYHRLGLYQEVARPLGVDDMVRLWLDPTNVRLEFDRADWGFPERDRLVLDLLLLRLRQLQRNAARRSSAPGSTAGCLTPREREILALVAEGRRRRRSRRASGSRQARCASTSRTRTRSSASIRGRQPSPRRSSSSAGTGLLARY